MRKLKYLAEVRLSSVDKKREEGEPEVRLCNYTDVYNNATIDNSLDFMLATASPEESRRFALRKGDVIITKDSEAWDDIAVPAYVAEDLDHVLCGYHLALVRPDPERLEGRFLRYAFAARGIVERFHVEALGVTRFALGYDALASVAFPVPTLAEQPTIADFLDRETARIDALIAKKERLLELLEEKRTALITRAVTKGLDPAVPMKDSGVEWLGEVPAHWEVVSLARVVDPKRPITYGIVQPGRLDPQGIMMIRGQDYSGGWAEPASIFRVSSEVEAPYTRSRLKANDIVLTIVGAGVGNVAVVPEWLDGANLTQTTARIAVDHRYEGKYFYFQLQSEVGRVNVDLAVRGAAQPTLTLANVARFRVVVPPRHEQAVIARQIRAATERIEHTGQCVRRAIALLREYRTALISAAVTGQIDVQEQVTSNGP